ncbi:transcriptional regulator, TetR family [Aeromicrobium marinum DSM 15272]|uniref:Transcriptional regulator, TetR family n=1 Tax=Aeromicrobium marinum DSM 15272 TaxID=585531 RepID=E2SAU2_9ACTN|nr:TetR/AcrR family transcriptional regulator [Aeromicrobium marinum]EFQ83488.1 transcriptional regulator, TetR family [Aeromicrobium marinum DSM 15272]
MTPPEPPSAPRTARQRAREQITAEILGAARTQLTRVGPSELSLREVARDVGMVSSAVYRYVSSRDELLTALLVLGYDELGAAVEQADRQVTDRSDHLGRWRAACRAVRTWALAHPGDYALLYGSPVPGYAAPQDTIGPATRTTVVLVTIVVDAHAADRAPRASDDSSSTDLARTLGAAVEFVRSHGIGDDVPPELVLRTLMGWTSVFGTISFELFGHLVGSVSDTAAYYDEVITRLAADLGIS